MFTAFTVATQEESNVFKKKKLSVLTNCISTGCKRIFQGMSQSKVNNCSPETEAKFRVPCPMP